MSLAMALGAVAMLTGCSNQKHVSAWGVRNNPSPELEGIALSSEQRKSEIAVNENTTWRQIHDDIDWILLRNRPVPLTEYPVP